jgi:hypothetical protein
MLVALLPFHQLGLALLYRLGLPATLVRPLANWKEALVAAILLAAARAWVRRGHRLDALDKVAIAYLGLVSIYFLFPTLVNPSGFGDPGAPTDSYVRLLAWRVGTLFVILFLAARHAPLEAAIRPKIARALLVVGTLAAGLAVLEFAAPGVWDTIAVDTFQVNRYRSEVLDVQPFDHGTVVVRDIVAGREVVRAGGLLLSPLTLGFYLLLPLSLAVQQILRTRPSRAAVLSTGVLAAGLMVTFTRSAILGGLVVCLVALRGSHDGTATRRVRLGLFVAAALVVAIPVAAQTGLGARTTSALENEGSTADHLRSLRTGLDLVFEAPLGLGLGTQPGVGDRFATATRVTSENAYLQIANELGVVALVLWSVLLVMILRRTHRAISDDDDPMAPAWFSAGVALMVGGMFLHIWNDFTLAWTFWGCAGLIVGLADGVRREPTNLTDPRHRRSSTLL